MAQFKKNYLLILVPIVISVIAYVYLNRAAPHLQHLKTDDYWGRRSDSGQAEDESIRDFRISFPSSKIEELKRKLGEQYEFTPVLEGAELHEYGIDVNNLTEIINYWHDDYLPRWKEREDFFNRLPHFKTNIQGLDIHYIHAQPTGLTQNKKVIPILLLHGWPGSIREFYDFIPLLMKPNDKLNVVFEVIAPSLPGYGWSDAARRTGLGALKMSIVLRNLMLRLGRDRFIIQGGDWGSLLGNLITTLYPENVIGFHSNFCTINSPKTMLKLLVASVKPGWFIDEKYESMFFPMGEKFKFLLRESGYFHMLATKPDTAGATITGNPVGLAAFILEKFVRFSGRISLDAMLDNVMVYYLTNSFTTAGRLYAETFGQDYYNFSLVSQSPTLIPTACARFKQDIGQMLDWQLKEKYWNLVHSTFYMEGGHFAALETPKILYEDFIQFVDKFWLLEYAKK